VKGKMALEAMRTGGVEFFFWSLSLIAVEFLFVFSTARVAQTLYQSLQLKDLD